MIRVVSFNQFHRFVSFFLFNCGLFIAVIRTPFYTLSHFIVIVAVFFSQLLDLRHVYGA